MILDSLANAGLYHGLHPGLAASFAWMQGEGASAPEGTYELPGSVKAIVQSYETAPDASKKWETHRRNIDLQIVFSGSELVGWHPASELVSRIPYNDAKDAEFYEPPAVPAARFQLGEGSFAIFYPGDGHQPGVQDGHPAVVRKVVFKLPV